MSVEGKSMSTWVHLDGRLVKGEEATVSVFDHGFLYGDGLFETMRAYSGRVFRIDHHMRRLLESCRGLELKVPYALEDLKEAVYETIGANGLRDAYVRLTVTRGRGEARPDPTTCGAPTVVVVTRSFSAYSAEQYERGYRGCIVSPRQNSMSSLSRMKTTSFLKHILARMEARGAGFDEGILLNTGGFLCEGAVSNLFLVKDRTVRTPAQDCGILPGITRSVVVEIVHEEGIPLIEGELPAHELTQADECFLTNSLMEVMPLVEVDGKRIGGGKPGPVTRRISARYREKVEEEANAQPS
jgi:branched-chain amino acid aminotransferase